MSDIQEGYIVTVKKGVYWNGNHIGGKEGSVLDTSSYILVKLDDYPAEKIKLLRYEISYVEDPDTYMKRQIYMDHILW